MCFVLNGGGALGFPALKGHFWALLVKVVYSWYILRFGFVLEPPGILGIFGSFWGYLVYFVPFGGFIGVSVVYFVLFGASSGILGILRFGFVLEPPGIVGILPSFWGYLLYFVPFGASLGDTWYTSFLWGLHLAHLVYTSFWLCFEASGDTWYTPFLLGILGILGPSFGILGIYFAGHSWEDLVPKRDRRNSLD